MSSGFPVPAGLLDSLNEQQREAVCTLDGPLLVVAGPGSGKTRVLTHRVAALIATGVEAQSILALTFTNKAADEMRSRIAGLVSSTDASRLWVSTFHSFCLRLLRAAPEAGGLPPSFTVVDAKDSFRMVKAVTVEAGLPVENAAAFANRISFAKNHLRTVDDLDEGSDVQLAAVWAAYQERLEAVAGVDFDDLLLRALRALRIPQVRRRVQQRFSRVLVDEWQDTNRVQYEIVAAITERSRQLAVVGDAQQAIYGWRGSTPEVLEAFTAGYPEAKVVTLGQNYRSTPQILEVARRVIAASPSQFGSDLWTANPPGAAVRAYAAADTDDEARWVIEDMKDRPGTVAVLVRTNAQTRAFEHELAARGVPYQMVGSTRFYDRAEVRDALAYLRLVVNPADAIAFERAAMTPRRKVGPRTVEVYTNACAAAGVAPGDGLFVESVVSALDGRSGPAIERMAADMAKVHAATGAGVVATLDAVLDDVGLYEFYLRKDPDRAANLEALREAAATFTAQTAAAGVEQVRRFIELTALVSAADADEGHRVSLITAHAAKGREFDHVYVVGVERDLFPHRLALDESGDDEERRLFFVAVTRARKTLTVSYRARRFFAGRWEDATPSPFLDAVFECDVVRVTSPRFAGRFARASHGQGAARRRSGSSVSPRRRPGSGFGQPLRPRPAVRRPERPNVDVESLQVGRTVEHPVFGSGTIIERDGATVTVRFTDETRRLALEWAPLTVV